MIQIHFILMSAKDPLPKNCMTGADRSQQNIVVM